MKIVIPSYNRSNIIMNKTIKLLQKLDIPMNIIYLFVIEEEICSYKNILPKDINLIAGPLGLHHMRNFITNYFDEGEELLCMDDDIENIYISDSDNKLNEMYKEYFIQWTECAFTMLKNNNCRLFGIYPVRNPFFMKDSEPITTTLKFCVGAFYGCINTKSVTIQTEEKEDFDRTLQFFILDNKIIRFNRICIKTNYYKNKGGMQSGNKNRIETSEIACKYLLETYPRYTKLYTGKKTGIYEIRLRS